MALYLCDGTRSVFCCRCSYGFIINHIVEPQPPENMMDIPGMQDEMRRPIMLIVSANKKVDR